jgi:organic radical activating enzyme
MKHFGHLDLNVAAGCNFSCTSCSHASPVNDHWMMTPEELEYDLAAIWPFMNFHRLQMVGGEPTLNKQLPELMRVARASGVGREIMVITNGSLLKRMPDEFWKELDTLQLSIYPRLDPDIPEFAKEKCNEFHKPFYSTTFTDFYQQIRSVTNDGSHFHSCHWRNDCWTLHRGHFYFCPQSLFFPKALLGHESTDGLPVSGLTDAKLDEFLTRKEPLEACKVCMANEMKGQPWTESKRSEWIAKSTV